jgi:hypothetical protein
MNPIDDAFEYFKQMCMRDTTQIDEIIENAKQMDQSDKIDKIKKESYMSICDSSKKIIENLSNNLIKIPDKIKHEIISNVTEIYDSAQTWMK